jgi:hypothetical protein
MMITMTMTAPVNESTLINSHDFVHRDFRTLLMLPTPADPQHSPFVSLACMQDSNTATTTRAGGDARRKPVMDRTTTMRVSPCHPFFSFLPLLPFLIHLPCMVQCCENVCARKTLANPSFSFQTPDYLLVCCHCGHAQVAISWLAPRTPVRHVLEDALPLLSNSLPILIFAPTSSSDIS